VKTRRTDERIVRELGMRGFGWVLLVCGALGVACATPERRPSGPPPEYIAPRVLPWDAGVSVEPEDPFAAAAAGEWLDQQEASPGSVDAGQDAMAPVDAGSAPDAAADPGDARVYVDGGSPTHARPAGDAAAQGEVSSGQGSVGGELPNRGR